MRQAPRLHQLERLEILLLFEFSKRKGKRYVSVSQQGKQSAMQSKLKAAVRDLRDAKQPIAELQARLDRKRSAIAMPPFDKMDIRGFLCRQELRSALRGMDAGQRALALNDPAFADAALEQPPALSGLLPGEKFLIDQVRERRLETLFAAELTEISELEKTVSEANMIADLARVDLKLHSEMEDRAFAEFCRPIENRQSAPWLIRSGDTILRVRPEMRGTPQLHQPATPDEIRDGIYFDSEAAFQASRAA